ncbi:unnamed protein product [Parnassius apollo]|uniref:(apollo) hypothetical protein n=1 Tax=Parnassius apollo TaxID=110799 RepID=A0A8S3WC01_PARAO|nr:unnamed protein product [Parnassius apollo]
MDETGLFFNLLPDRTLRVKGEKCRGGTRSKQRLTVVLTCNSDGSHKLKPWVIGKSEKPHCFSRNRVDVNLLPCKYTFHENSWVDSKPFRTWITEFNKEMAKKNRHVLLTMDNFSGHNIKELNFSKFKVNSFLQIIQVDSNRWTKESSKSSSRVIRTMQKMIIFALA